jgi:lactoylglutathione lyase
MVSHKKSKRSDIMNFCWCTITVKSLEESLRFYRDVVGLEVVSRFSPGDGMEIVFLNDSNGVQIELLYNKNIVVSGDKAGISVGFEVDSLESALALVKENGIAVSQAPVTTPAVRFFFVKDPNGVTIQFAEKADSGH